MVCVYTMVNAVFGMCVTTCAVFGVCGFAKVVHVGVYGVYGVCYTGMCTPTHFHYRKTSVHSFLI